MGNQQIGNHEIGNHEIGNYLMNIIKLAIYIWTKNGNGKLLNRCQPQRVGEQQWKYCELSEDVCYAGTALVYLGLAFHKLASKDCAAAWQCSPQLWNKVSRS